MKVSVIIVTYNQKQYIGRAIEHALAQICDFDFEIILGDDVSTDGTAEICRDYEARNPGKIRVVTSERNRGVAGNYYDCLEAARGEYVADLGGDDFWTDPHKLQKEADFLDRHPGVSLVHTDWEYHDETDGRRSPSDPAGIRRKWHREVMPSAEIFPALLQRLDAPIVHLCTAMYRRETAMRLYRADRDLFRGKGVVFEDLQLIISLAHEGDIGFLPDVTLAYSIGHSSMSSEEDYAKSYRLYRCTLDTVRRLELKYGVRHEALLSSYGELVHFLFAQAFHLRDRERRDEMLTVAGAYGIPLLRKTRILAALSRNGGVWRLAEASLRLTRRLLGH